MTDEQSKPWNDWCRSICEKYAGALGTETVKFVVGEVNKLVDDITKAFAKRDGEITKLREQVIKLQGESEVLRSIVRGEIASIKQGKSDAA